ncbi:hypothetical protein M8J76_003515 [Diaphorina citri]|nr:hypothetical protein M8J76_003515 [Diaphorina citri]
MELFRTQQYYILLNKDSTLWIDRTTGQLDAKPAWELANGQDIECLGVFYGLVGRVKYNKVDRFILIRDSVLVGTVPIGNEVYKIKSIVLLNPCTDHVDDLGLRICSKHNYEDFVNLSVTPESTSTGNSAFARAWGNVKTATLNQLKTSNFQTNAQAKGPSLHYKENLNITKHERRIEDEILRIFTDSDSFYYCPDNKGDITNSVPRQGNDYSRAWVNPIIQGYVEIAPIYKLDLSLILISRRSRFRAGTRYKRRGLNPEGHCANYVETEQIISYKSHAVSFVQVRGSVPLFWSQPGIKYRPAPILHRNFAENQQAFEKHFEEQLSLYAKVIIVNLVEQMGKESIIYNAYTQHVLSLNNEQLVYVSFDFHEYCRGMHFERVSLLTDKLKQESIFQDMGYSWKDKQGLICQQKAIFRVNCIDCLDRTNVVQTALAKTVLIKQLKKLGIVSPEGDLPKDMNSKFQVMWANNGDIISKQYAGTAALKGDFTRTGDRKLSGLMKDGMTSANRYYLSRFKDNMRQSCIDIMYDDDVDNSEEEDPNAVLHIKTLIEDCKRLMLTDQEHVINAWPLIAWEEQGSGGGEDFDRILILTKDMLKIAEYNVHLDSMKLMVCVPLKTIVGLYLGPLNKSTTNTPVNSPNTALHTKSKRLYMKLVLRGNNSEVKDLILTSSRIHYFNNQVSLMRSIDEKNESLRAVVESIQICMRLSDCPVEVNYGPIDLSKSRSGKEAVESYIPNIGIIRSNVSIEATEELDLNDILIDENLSMDEHSTPSNQPDLNNSTTVDLAISLQATSNLQQTNLHESPQTTNVPSSITRQADEHIHDRNSGYVQTNNNKNVQIGEDGSHNVNILPDSSNTIKSNPGTSTSNIQGNSSTVKNGEADSRENGKVLSDSSAVKKSEGHMNLQLGKTADGNNADSSNVDCSKTDSNAADSSKTDSTNADSIAANKVDEVSSIDNDVRLGGAPSSEFNNYMSASRNSTDCRISEEEKGRSGKSSKDFEEYDGRNRSYEGNSEEFYRDNSRDYVGSTKSSKGNSQEYDGSTNSSKDYSHEHGSSENASTKASKDNTEKYGERHMSFKDSQNTKSSPNPSDDSGAKDTYQQGSHNSAPQRNFQSSQIDSNNGGVSADNSSSVGGVANSSVSGGADSNNSIGGSGSAKSSVILKLNSCDLQDPLAADVRKPLTLDLISENYFPPGGNFPQGGNFSQGGGTFSPKSQNKSNENLSTLRTSPETACKIVKSSSEKDLLLTNTIKTSQSDNTSLRQNIKTAIVSPTNALSKFVTKGVQNLNSLDPRRRLSMNVQRVPTTPSGAGVSGQENREKLEEKWRKYGCKSKLIAL